MKPLLSLVVAFLCFSDAIVWRGEAKDSRWTKSIVTVEATRKQYDYFQPWSRRTARTLKTGVVVKGERVLTTADEMFDSTLIRLQQNGRGKWWTGHIEWIDYPANLALVTVDDPEFWPDLKPVSLVRRASSDASFQIMRWREGNLEKRTAEFTQYTVKQGQLGGINQVQLVVNSDIQGVGQGEPVIAGSRLAGLMTEQAGRACTALPASFIDSVLKARDKGEYPGLGYLHFYWQPGENPESLRQRGLPGEPRGVLVHYVPNRLDGLDNVLQFGDIILEIDGFKVDTDGDYDDPEFGLLMIENMAARGKWAGAELPIKIWRDGAEREVIYRLPKLTYDHQLVPYANFDKEPEYLIVGGLVFQPLTGDYLRTWGADWERRAPFRLVYYQDQPVTPERPSLVLLSQVLPDEFNIGYQTLKYMVVDKVNGRNISRLADLQKALQHPMDGFHLIEFMGGEQIERVVLEAGTAEAEATQRVLQQYRIDQPVFLAPDGTAEPETRDQR